MDKFFNFLKTGLVATVLFVVAFVITYIPVPHTYHEAEAFTVYCSNCSTFLGNNAGFTALGGELTTLVALEAQRESREQILTGTNGWAWWAAKVIVSQMLKSMIAWINSGFENERPMFVEDLQGFLVETADRAFGEYIQEISSVGSFICDPFKLDVRIALSLLYDQAKNQPAPTCTLTGIIDNIEGFLDGTRGSFAQGGWNDWIDITSAPQVYTPYGALISADTGAQARIVNARGAVLKELDFGNGFLSAKECTELEEGGVERTICNIVTPGKTIETALSFNINGEQQSLIAADEVNEVVGALFGALANKVFAEGRGLLQ